MSAPRKKKDLGNPNAKTKSTAKNLEKIPTESPSGPVITANADVLGNLSQQDDIPIVLPNSKKHPRDPSRNILEASTPEDEFSQAHSINEDNFFHSNSADMDFRGEKSCSESDFDDDSQRSQAQNMDFQDSFIAKLMNYLTSTCANEETLDASAARKYFTRIQNSVAKVPLPNGWFPEKDILDLLKGMNFNDAHEPNFQLFSLLLKSFSTLAFQHGLLFEQLTECQHMLTENQKQLEFNIKKIMDENSKKLEILVERKLDVVLQKLSPNHMPLPNQNNFGSECPQTQFNLPTQQSTLNSPTSFASALSHNLPKVI
jgi:hypothetical protein